LREKRKLQYKSHQK